MVRREESLNLLGAFFLLIFEFHYILELFKKKRKR